MPKITEILPQKSSKGRSASGRKNSHRFNIYLDGQFAFGADEDLVVERRLILGKLLNPLDVDKLLFEAEVGKLMERMYGLFNIRQRSEKEVRDYLKNLSFKRKVKGKEEISDVAIDLVAKKLKQKKLLNDEEFAKSWLEARSKKKGIMAIKGELYKKGINQEIIEETIGVEDLRAKQKKTAEQLLLKRLPRLKILLPQDMRKKAYDFLLRRGFQYEIVKEIVEKLLGKEYTNL